MFFLPFERLPAWILGPMCVVGSIIALVQPDLTTWDRIKACSFLLMGVGLFVYGVRELKNAPPLPRSARNSRDTLSTCPDFSKYNEAELRQILTRINRDRYPERAAEVEDRLARLAESRGT